MVSNQLVVLNCGKTGKSAANAIAQLLQNATDAENTQYILDRNAKNY